MLVEVRLSCDYHVETVFRQCAVVLVISPVLTTLGDYPNTEDREDEADDWHDGERDRLDEQLHERPRHVNCPA